MPGKIITCQLLVTNMTTYQNKSYQTSKSDIIRRYEEFERMGTVIGDSIEDFLSPS